MYSSFRCFETVATAEVAFDSIVQELDSPMNEPRRPKCTVMAGVVNVIATG